MTDPTGINAFGQIVGFFQQPDGTIHGFLFSAGRYSTLDVPGATLTRAYGLNDAGQIVGEFEDIHGRTHGFLAAPILTTVTDLLEAVIAQIQSIPSLNHGKETSLTSKLKAAERSVSRRNDHAATGQLEAFIHEVDAKGRSGHLQPALAELLIAEAQAIIDRI